LKTKEEKIIKDNMKRRRKELLEDKWENKQKKKKTMVGLFVLALFFLNPCHLQQQNRRELR
jgi:hypothetical protein